MTPLDEIVSDLDWREAELAVLRILVSDSSLKGREKTVLFRAAWALLYAHYEGFFKFALTVYYDEISKRRIKCSTLPLKMQQFALAKEIKLLRGEASDRMISRICNFPTDHLESPANFPEVETQSNLWPETLFELLGYADLNLPSINLHDRKLETLVRRRNKIAHGERDIISDLTYYLQYEEAFTIVAYELVFAIEDRLNTI
ncbi:MAG: hypothetical protein C0471_19360 [Erythrobacter sp.]|nr:hypothetical protein [Erythrobacter sp.]